MQQDKIETIFFQCIIHETSSQNMKILNKFLLHASQIVVRASHTSKPPSLTTAAVLKGAARSQRCVLSGYF